MKLEFFNEVEKFKKYEKIEKVELMSHYKKLKFKKQLAQKIFDKFLKKNIFQIPLGILKRVENQLHGDPKIIGFSNFFFLLL